MMYGPQAAFYSEIFSTRMRYSGASLGVDLGVRLRFVRRAGQRDDERAEDDYDEEGRAEAESLGDEADGGRTDQEAEVTGGGDGGYRGTGRRSCCPAGGAQSDREDYRETGPDAGETEEGDERVPGSQGKPEPARRHGGPRPD